MTNTPPLSSDVFDVPIGDGTQSELDLGSHYPISAERWRLFVDGTRKFPQYNNVSQYAHITDVHELSPAGGETVTLETTERSQYVVQYEQIYSFASALNQSLSGDDRYRVGAFTDNEGWYLEHRGDHPDDSTVDVKVRRNGNTKTEKTDLTLPRPVTDFTREELRTGWYSVTRQRWRQSVTDNGSQKNQLIGTTSADGERGPQVGNIPSRYELKADSNTSDLKLFAGSVALITLGQGAGAIDRTKTVPFKENVDDGTDTWIPIYAIRTDPGREIINTQLVNIDVREFAGNGDVKVMAVAFDPSKLEDSNNNAIEDGDFSPPNAVNSQSSVLEETTAVDQFPDSSGTVGTSADDPGGWQVEYGSLYTSGQGQEETQASGARQVKSQISDRDIVVFLARATATGDVSVEYTVAENW